MLTNAQYKVKSKKTNVLNCSKRLNKKITAIPHLI